MKNFFKLLGIIAFIAITGFLMAACDLPEEDYSLEGNWASSIKSYKFSGDNFEYWQVGQGRIKGTFTYTSTHITFNTTHYWSSFSDSWEETTLHSYSFPPHFNYDSSPVSYKIEKLKDGQLILTIGNYDVHAWASEVTKNYYI
jgi:hypothetical protein